MRKALSLFLIIIIVFFLSYNLNSKYFNDLLFTKRFYTKKSATQKKSRKSPTSSEKAHSPETINYITGSYHYSIYKKTKQKINNANEKHNSELEKLIND